MKFGIVRHREKLRPKPNKPTHRTAHTFPYGRTCCHDVTRTCRSDLGQQRLVCRLSRTLVQVLQPEKRRELRLHAHMLIRESHRLAQGGKFELHLGDTPAPLITIKLSRRLEHIGNNVELLGRRSLAGILGARGRNNFVVHAQVCEGHTRHCHERASVDLFDRAPTRAHKAAAIATSLCLNESAVTQSTQRFTHRHYGNSHERRQFGLARESLPLGECTNRNRLHEPRFNEFRAPLFTNRSKGGRPQTTGRGLRKR